MKKIKNNFLILLFGGCMHLSSLSAQQTETLYLSGTDKDHTVTWDFFCSGGRNAQKWTSIQVPSCWEQQGFGSYDYGGVSNDKKADETGKYRYRFEVPSAWKGKTVQIVFEGSMTDTRVLINGKQAGPVHRGAFYRFSYDVTGLLKYGGENLLEAEVAKMSSDKSVNDAERSADYWVFGGIFRPVYLQAIPQEHIQRVAIDARHDGKFYMEVHTPALMKNAQVEVQLSTPEGKPVGKAFTGEMKKGDSMITLSSANANVESWNPERPVLYKVSIRLLRDGKELHRMQEKFGFRSFEVRPKDGLYLNGQKIILKGVNRHSFWPETGRTTSKEISILDVKLMKDMNMNAVRMSHYPPDVDFLDVCDSMGLLVLDELAGWQDGYSVETGRPLVKEMILRDVNHPCIIFWDNGNEGGWNYGLDDDFARWDPQKRQVIHPWEKFRGIDCQHYKSYYYGTNDYFGGEDIFFPTEFLHGLYDGGMGAGLESYWEKITSNPLGAGGFLWVFADEGVVRTDMNGWIDTQKNNAPDGIVGPHREKEGSFYSIREIWSPVHFPARVLPEQFDGSLQVENRFFFTKFSNCTFKATLQQFGFSNSSHQFKQADIKVSALLPGEKGMLQILLPADWKNFDRLNIEVSDPSGRTVISRSWPLVNPSVFAEKILQKNQEELLTTIEANDENIVMKQSGTKLVFDRRTRMLKEWSRKGEKLSLANGPLMIGGDVKPDTVIWYRQNFDYVIRSVQKGKHYFTFQWTLRADGWLSLEYEYSQWGVFDFLGVTFNYPDSLVKGISLYGDGPYRVWKNRLRGPEFGCWEKTTNNTITGESWDYPEFKGYYSHFYGAVLKTTEGDLQILCGEPQIFLRLLTPEPPKGAYNKNTAPAFPPGSISFLHGITPIGDKFTEPANLTPEGWSNQFFPSGRLMHKRGVIYFRF